MESTVSGAAVKIRRLEAHDIDAIIEIQTQCREASQWSRNDYESLVRDGAPCFVAEIDGRVSAFLAARELTDELEILNLAVTASARRHGTATELLREAMHWAAENGISKVHLEVRASNVAARNFYASCGFLATGKRPNYYRDPADDALLLTAPVNNH